jgi:hypothetical protein
MPPIGDHTWIVLPFIAVTTSPGFVALFPGMFSHRGINPVKKNAGLTH